MVRAYDLVIRHPIEVTVDTSRLHFFDLATGLSIRA
jgi:hypothetical protein